MGNSYDEPESRKSRLVGVLIDVAPLVLIIAVFAFFSYYRIPSQEFAATATNSLGLITGNFVYDTQWNLYFIFASTLIVEAVVLLCPVIEKRAFMFGYPAVVIGSGVVANWLVFQTPYVKPLYCINCQVSGMSNVASASVGVALAASLGTLAVLRRAGTGWAEDEDDKRAYRRWLFLSFVTSVASVATFFLFLLSFFGGLSPATEFDHATSLVLGMALTVPAVLMPFSLRDLPASLAGSKKLFVGIIGLMVVVVGLTSPVYPVQYQTYHPGTWGGYVAFGGSNGSVSAVTGEWVVPAVNCSGTRNGAVSFWVGIDGYGSNYVEQGGTRAGCADGQASYSAWYEFWPLQPNSMVFPDLKIAPGNLVMASVKYVGGAFNITVTDLSTNQSKSTMMVYPGAPRAGAEWIVEAPEYQNNTRAVIPSFSQVRFNDSYATIDGVQYSIGSARTGTVLYYCVGDRYALVPSILGSGWTSFTVFSVDLAGCPT